MYGLPTGRGIGRGLVVSALLSCSSEVFAADPAGTVAPAHGPMLMLYFSQPLLSGASRTYGLRLNQASQTPQSGNALAAPIDFYAASPRRSLFDLQIRRRADVRLQLGNHVTWNLRSREFEFPNARAAKPIQFAASTP